MNLPPLPDVDTSSKYWESEIKAYAKEYGELCRKQALEEAAKRSDAYSYMSQNFVALAEELRRMV